MNTRKGIKSLLIIVVAAMAVMVTSASAEITVDASATWQSGSSDLGGTFDASGSDKLVVIVTGEHGFNQTANGWAGDVFYDGVQLTAAVKRQPIKANVATGVLVDDTYNAIYYLDDPDTSAGIITTSGFQSRGSVAVVVLSGTAAGVGSVVTGVRDTNTADLTTSAGSIVIGSYGLGGSGNTAQLAPITTPDWDAELARQENGSNWDGHVVAYNNGVAAGTATYTFDDTTLPGADGRTGRHVIAAEFEPFIPDPNLPTVDLGKSWITWSGQGVTLEPSIINNDTQVPQRTLSYAWTADPDDGVVFTPNANVQAPAVTITKAADTGDATTVELTLTVTLEGLGTVEEVMSIYVFDDACHAGVGSGSVIPGAGDFNGSCFTDIYDFALLASLWMADYDTAELSMLAESWLEGGVLNAPVITAVTVPDVTGQTQTAAQGTLTGAGFTASLVYEYDENVPLNYVISQSPAADSEVPDGINVTLAVSRGDPPASQITVADVYLAQNHVQEPDDALFKLAGNRDTLLKVQVIAPIGTAVPTVTAVLSVDDDTMTLTLDAPPALQDTFEDKLGKVQHKYDDSFTKLIPAQWIRPGLSITVTAGNSIVSHDIKVGAPSVIKMKMFDVHYFGLGTNDYPAGTLEELEAKWPVSELVVERIRNINFHELVIPARAGAPNVRVSSKQDYYVQTGLGFDGEQAAALQWVEALSASGGNFDVAMQYINIIGVSAGGQAGGFDGVGGISVGILNHELGHALSLPHWGDNASYPYKGEMYGIEPQPGVYMGTHVGPTWAFDLPSLTFIPPTVQENSVGGAVGYYKKSPMQGGGTGDQEVGFLMRHFSDYAVNKMQNYIEGKVAVLRDGEYYKWNEQEGDYTTSIVSNGVRYPIEEDVQVISVMASMTLSDMNVNMVYPPIGPYEGNLIRTFDPTSSSDRAAAKSVFAPSSGCDFTLRVVQGGVTSYYMLPASGTEGGDPYSSGSLKTAAVNLPASDGTITQVKLLLTPDAEDNGLPANPQVLYTWTE